MCIVFYFKTKSNELLIFSNRDEYLSRESSFIEIKNRIIGGRDKREHQEGLWLGISLDGKFGFITNYIQSDLSGLSNQSSQSNQSLQISSKDKITRGVLIRDYLQGDKPPQEYLKSLNLSKFNGFTLVVGTLNSTFLISNCKSPPVFEEMKVNEVYVISNGKFDEGDWEKVRRGKELFKNLLGKLCVLLCIDCQHVIWVSTILLIPTY